MKVQTILFFISSLFLLVSCNTSSNSFNTQPRSSMINGSDRPANTKPGECYAKCLIPDQSETSSNMIAVYTGDENIEDVDIKVKRVEISPGGSEWVKKKADRNCQSADPNDCLVWCLVERPGEYKEYKIVTDTTQTSNYEIVELKQEKLTKKGGYTEWRTVVCSNQITNSLISDIQTALKENNFYRGDITGKIGAETKSALTLFQQKNKLPVGQLDHETLDVLGISF